MEVLPGAEHVVSMRVSGRIEKEDVERCIAAVEEALARQDRIALYAEVAMSGMTPGAFARDLGYGLRHLSELRRFARMAV
nr:STAS/SEC14 domain-containing protein [Microvirga tunisiensis]